MNIRTNKPYNKSVLALILASILIGSTVVGIASAFRSGQSTVGPYFADYVTLEGVAGNDYYDSRQHSWNVNDWAYATVPGYPAKNPANMWFTAGKSLRWGMTEFGEFATPANTGIAYGANSAEWAITESWANIAINPALYIQGWTFFMNYTRAGVYRAIEAYALYSDLMATEGGRKVYSWFDRNADGSVHYNPSQAAAQLTNGSLSAGGVQILYDSARLAVARSTVTIRDGFYNEDVAKVTFTVILNKDTKYAIVYKDVKILIDPKVLDLIQELTFTERYEIDLARGTNPSNQAYIHWYESYNTTVYTHPLTGEADYDVLQAFNPDRNYTFFAAYWPETTEYAVYHPLVPDIPRDVLQLLVPGTAIADIPSPQNEPNTPWVIAQWRYNTADFPKMLQFLAKSANREIRFVEVAGMTDYNMGTSAYAPFRAKDANSADQVNNVDVEVRYLLNNVFNPEDLTDAADEPFMWVGLGQSAATTDSAGAAAMADFGQWGQMETLGLFDRNDTAFPWTAPVVTMAGTIPFALDNDGNFAPNYLEAFNNTGKGTGADATVYSRTGLNGFVFNYYDGSTATGVNRNPPQPIAGGQGLTGQGVTSYWYPSEDPLYERWVGSTTFSPAPYLTWGMPNGIVSLGGMKANGITRYFNDFGFAISREGTSNFALVNGGSVTGSAPTSDATKATIDYLPLSTWATSQSTFNYKAGYAVISIASDVNGTRSLSVYGWNGRDTYWAAAWASQYCGTFSSWIPAGTVALVLNISYSAADREPTSFTVVKALGTITEFGANAFITAYGDFDEDEYDWAPASTVVPPALPAVMVEGQAYAGEWWYAKLPTTSIAKVDFDP